MVKKRNEEYSKTNDNKMNYNPIFNLNIEDENFKEEALFVYNAINGGQIDLSPTEKKELLQELDLILNHFESSENNNSDSISNSSDIKDNLNSKNDMDNKHKNSSNLNDSFNSFEDSSKLTIHNPLQTDSSQDMVDNQIDEKCSDSNESEYNSSLDAVEDDLSVDDALHELIDEEISSSNDSHVDVSSENLIPLEDEWSLSDNSDDFDDLSVDDALNDLIVNYSNDVAIKVENVSMEFKVSKDKIDTLKEFFIRTIKRNKSGTEIITALHDVSFEIPKGDRVGIIGFNGAGKSTLLKVLSGVYDATEGTIKIKGKIAPLLELGAGFDFNYTGKDNIFLNGAFLGYSEDFLKEKYDEIVEFSELGDAINYHVKTYSSGMRAKLGFAIATIVEPDILILDEILSVGDIRFRKKSADKIRSLINSGITVLLVSHSVGQIRDLCNKAIWIDNGELKMYGEVNEVCDAYTKAANNATKEQIENIKLD